MAIYVPIVCRVIFFFLLLLNQEMCREKMVCSLLTSHSLFQIISRDVNHCKGRLHVDSGSSTSVRQQSWDFAAEKSILVHWSQWYKWQKQLTYFLSTTFLRRLINWLMDTLWNCSPLFSITLSQFQTVTPPPKSHRLQLEQWSAEPLPPGP